uniref:Uncharacterized protein n=1 Tax=Anguilla anguilla TaxID=7936 RepID=A0A0E9PCV6_ANGAN
MKCFASRFFPMDTTIILPAKSRPRDAFFKSKYVHPSDVCAKIIPHGGTFG